jgi:hypothetical protein
VSGQVPAPRSRRARAAKRTSRDYRADGIWIAGFVVASVVGGLAAAALTHLSTAVAVLAALVVAGVAAVALQAGVLDDRRPDGRRARHGGGGLVDQPDVPPETAANGPDVAQGSPMEWPWPLEAADHGPLNAGGAQARPPVRVLQDPAVTNKTRGMRLADFLGQAVIAQCPHCAGFRIDADTRSPHWRFACRACGWQWSWQPGTPWPEVHVRPEERRYSDRY